MTWRPGDVARWQGIDCTIEYVSTSDGALQGVDCTIEYVSTSDSALISYRLPGESEEIKYAIVSLADLTERSSNGDRSDRRR